MLVEILITFEPTGRRLGRFLSACNIITEVRLERSISFFLSFKSRQLAQRYYSRDCLLNFPICCLFIYALNLWEMLKLATLNWFVLIIWQSVAILWELWHYLNTGSAIILVAKNLTVKNFIPRILFRWNCHCIWIIRGITNFNLPLYFF